MTMFNKSRGSVALATALLLSTTPYMDGGGGHTPTLKEAQELLRDSEAERKKRLLAKGHQVFNYLKGSVIALNQKAADKKARRNGWIS